MTNLYDLLELVKSSRIRICQLDPSNDVEKAKIDEVNRNLHRMEKQINSLRGVRDNEENLDNLE